MMDEWELLNTEDGLKLQEVMLAASRGKTPDLWKDDDGLEPATSR
jgi:hypothetical protein